MGEEGRDRDERREHDREPRPQAHEQPDGLRADEEDPEVVRGERERQTTHHPASQRRSPRSASPKVSTDVAPSSANNAYDRASCEYQTRNGLVATSAAATMPARRDTSTHPGAVRDRDRRGPRERGERPQADLAEPEDRAPEPRDDVVEVRRRLGPRDLAEDVAEAAIEQRRGDELVEPEALPVERREAEHGAEQREREDRPVPHRGGTHQADERRAGPRSPASAARAVTMKSG